MCICVYSASGVLLRSSDGWGGSGRLRANWNAAGPAQLSWADEVQFAQSFQKKKREEEKKEKVESKSSKQSAVDNIWTCRDTVCSSRTFPPRMTTEATANFTVRDYFIYPLIDLDC